MSARTLERDIHFPLLTGIALVIALSGSTPSSGHQHTAPWLDESALDRGLYVEVRHPRVIRNPRAFEVSVLVNNLLGAERVSVREVRYSLPGAFDRVAHPRRHDLPSKRNAYRRYKAILEEMELAGQRRDRASVERLRNESLSVLRDIAAPTFRDAQRVEAGYRADVGGVMNVAVEVDVVEGGRLRTIRRDVAIALQPPLPVGADGLWFAGDQHLHTAYSIDAFLLDGTRESVTQYAATAQTIGLDWIIITDHTNVDVLFWYKPYLFALGEAKARRYRERNDYLVLQGQEMGIGSPGRFGEAAHLLAYPRAEDSTGFLVNPCPGLIFGHAKCEPEQVVLDRVNDNGGIGFIAHPFDAVPFFYAPWDGRSGAVGWAGLEIFSNHLGTLRDTDSQAIAWWHELLDDIPPPSGGQLAVRPDYPTRFPVGIGNSDAHQPARIGNTFSYAHLPGVLHGAGMVPREDVMSAFIEGRLVASNGPLAYGEIDGAGTGEVAVVSPGPNPITLTLETTPEFGPVSDYELKIFVNGVLRRSVPPDGATGFQRTVVVEEVFSPPDKFVTVTARRFQCGGCSPDELRFLSLANPIWLELSTPTTAPWLPHTQRGEPRRREIHGRE
jgi:hypothetical protein